MNNLNISQAISLMREGMPVARLDWENDRFIYLVPANEYPAQTEVAKTLAKENGKVPYLEYIAEATDKGIKMYSPTCEDILAEDWITVKLA